MCSPRSNRQPHPWLHPLDAVVADSGGQEQDRGDVKVSVNRKITPTGPCCYLRLSLFGTTFAPSLSTLNRTPRMLDPFPSS